MNKLTWDDLANLYKERTGGTARTQPMDNVFTWAQSQPDIKTTPGGYLCKVAKEERE